MSSRSFALLAVVGFALAGALGLMACVEVPDNMRAEFAGPGPNDPDNYRPGKHGTAPPNVTHFKISGSYDAGTVDASSPPATADVDAGTPAPVDADGGNT